MGKSIISMRAQSLRTAPSLIDMMSFPLTIPWQVALPQSLPPLHHPAHTFHESAFVVVVEDYGGRMQLAIGECKTGGPKNEITDEDVANLASVADAFPHERV